MLWAHLHWICASWWENWTLSILPIKVSVSTSSSFWRHCRTKILRGRLHVDFLLFFEIGSVNFVMTLLCRSSATWITAFSLISTNRALFSRSHRVIFWIVRRTTDDSGSAQPHRWKVLFVGVCRFISAIQSKTKVLRRSGLIPCLRNPIMKSFALFFVLFQDLRATGSAMMAEGWSVENIIDQRSLVIWIATVLALAH